MKVDIHCHLIPRRFWDSADRGRDWQRAAAMLDMVINRYGTAGVKRALGMMGFEGMAPHSPLAQVSGQGETEIAEALDRTGLLPHA